MDEDEAERILEQYLRALACAEEDLVENRILEMQEAHKEVIDLMVVGLRAKRLSPDMYQVLTKPMFSRAAITPLTAEEKKVAGNVLFDLFLADNHPAGIGVAQREGKRNGRASKTFKGRL